MQTDPWHVKSRALLRALGNEGKEGIKGGREGSQEEEGEVRRRQGETERRRDRRGA